MKMWKYAYLPLALLACAPLVQAQNRDAARTAQSLSYDARHLERDLPRELRGHPELEHLMEAAHEMEAAAEHLGQTVAHRGTPQHITADLAELNKAFEHLQDDLTQPGSSTLSIDESLFRINQGLTVLHRQLGKSRPLYQAEFRRLTASLHHQSHNVLETLKAEFGPRSPLVTAAIRFDEELEHLEHDADRDTTSATHLREVFGKAAKLWDPVSAELEQISPYRFEHVRLQSAALESLMCRMDLLLGSGTRFSLRRPIVQFNSPRLSTGTHHHRHHRPSGTFRD